MRTHGLPRISSVGYVRKTAITLKKSAYEKTSQGGRLEVKGWPEGESNPRHADFQSAALPTELSGRLCRADLQLDYYTKSKMSVKREFEKSFSGRPRDAPPRNPSLRPARIRKTESPAHPRGRRHEGPRRSPRRACQSNSSCRPRTHRPNRPLHLTPNGSKSAARAHTPLPGNPPPCREEPLRVPRAPSRPGLQTRCPKHRPSKTCAPMCNAGTTTHRPRYPGNAALSSPATALETCPQRPPCAMSIPRTPWRLGTRARRFPHPSPS